MKIKSIQILKERIAYEKECAKTAVYARKAMLACIARESKGKTLH